MKIKHSFKLLMKVNLLTWKKGLNLALVLNFCLPIFSWGFNSQYISMPQDHAAISYQGKLVTIPEQFGTIESYYQGQDKTVILISDLHCNYEVQKNIAAMINHLVNKHDVKLIGEEGAFDTVDLDVLRDFPLENIKEAVTDYYVKQGKITGAEYYTATSKKEITLQGIENPKLYNDSYKMIKSFLNAQSQGYIYDLRDSLDALKPRLYNKTLIKLDAKKTAYREGGMMLFKYALSLHRMAEQLKLSSEDFSNLNHFIVAKKDHFTQEIKPEKLYQEIDVLDRLIREHLYTNKDQKKLDGLIARLDIMEKLLNISATQKELAGFRENRDDYKTQVFTDFLHHVGTNHELDLLDDVGISTLDNYLDQVAHFYKLADSRSDAFVENILHKMDIRNENISIMINGGFHLEHVMARLKQKSISFVAVRPSLTRQDIINPYFSLLQGHKLPIEKLLEKNQTIFANLVWPHHGSIFRAAMEINLDAAAKALIESMTRRQHNAIQKYFKKHNIVELQTLESFGNMADNKNVSIQQATIANSEDPQFTMVIKNKQPSKKVMNKINAGNNDTVVHQFHNLVIVKALNQSALSTAFEQLNKDELLQWTQLVNRLRKFVRWTALSFIMAIATVNAADGPHVLPVFPAGQSVALQTQTAVMNEATLLGKIETILKGFMNLKGLEDNKRHTVAMNGRNYSFQIRKFRGLDKPSPHDNSYVSKTSYLITNPEGKRFNFSRKTLQHMEFGEIPKIEGASGGSSVSAGRDRGNRILNLFGFAQHHPSSSGFLTFKTMTTEEIAKRIEELSYMPYAGADIAAIKNGFKIILDLKKGTGVSITHPIAIYVSLRDGIYVAAKSDDGKKIEYVHINPREPILHKKITPISSFSGLPGNVQRAWNRQSRSASPRGRVSSATLTSTIIFDWLKIPAKLLGITISDNPKEKSNRIAKLVTRIVETIIYASIMGAFLSPLVATLVVGGGISIAGLLLVGVGVMVVFRLMVYLHSQEMFDRATGKRRPLVKNDLQDVARHFAIMAGTFAIAVLGMGQLGTFFFDMTNTLAPYYLGGIIGIVITFIHHEMWNRNISLANFFPTIRRLTIAGLFMVLMQVTATISAEDRTKPYMGSQEQRAAYTQMQLVVRNNNTTMLGKMSSILGYFSEFGYKSRKSRLKVPMNGRDYELRMRRLRGLFAPSPHDGSRVSGIWYTIINPKGEKIIFSSQDVYHLRFGEIPKLKGFPDSQSHVEAKKRGNRILEFFRFSPQPNSSSLPTPKIMTSKQIFQRINQLNGYLPNMGASLKAINNGFDIILEKSGAALGITNPLAIYASLKNGIYIAHQDEGKPPEYARINPEKANPVETFTPIPSFSGLPGNVQQVFEWKFSTAPTGTVSAYEAFAMQWLGIEAVTYQRYLSAIVNRWPLALLLGGAAIVSDLFTGNFTNLPLNAVIAIFVLYSMPRIGPVAGIYVLLHQLRGKSVVSGQLHLDRDDLANNVALINMGMMAIFLIISYLFELSAGTAVPVLFLSWVFTESAVNLWITTFSSNRVINKQRQRLTMQTFLNPSQATNTSALGETPFADMLRRAIYGAAANERSMPSIDSVFGENFKWQNMRVEKGANWSRFGFYLETNPQDKNNPVLILRVPGWYFNRQKNEESFSRIAKWQITQGLKAAHKELRQYLSNQAKLEAGDLEEVYQETAIWTTSQKKAADSKALADKQGWQDPIKLWNQVGTGQTIGTTGATLIAMVNQVLAIDMNAKLRIKDTLANQVHGNAHDKLDKSWVAYKVASMTEKEINDLTDNRLQLMIRSFQKMLNDAGENQVQQDLVIEQMQLALIPSAAELNTQSLIMKTLDEKTVTSLEQKGQVDTFELMLNPNSDAFAKLQELMNSIELTLLSTDQRAVVTFINDILNTSIEGQGSIVLTPVQSLQFKDLLAQLAQIQVKAQGQVGRNILDYDVTYHYTGLEEKKISLADGREISAMMPKFTQSFVNQTNGAVLLMPANTVIPTFLEINDNVKAYIDQYILPHFSDKSIFIKGMTGDQSGIVQAIAALITAKKSRNPKKVTAVIRQISRRYLAALTAANKQGQDRQRLEQAILDMSAFFQAWQETEKLKLQTVGTYNGDRGITPIMVPEVMRMGAVYRLIYHFGLIGKERFEVEPNIEQHRLERQNALFTISGAA